MSMPNHGDKEQSKNALVKTHALIPTKGSHGKDDVRDPEELVEPFANRLYGEYGEDRERDSSDETHPMPSFVEDFNVFMYSTRRADG